MGSYEIIVKTEEIKRMAQEGNYSSAQKIVDTMNLKKIKNIGDLSLIAEVCTENGQLDKAMELLKRIYKKTRSRKALYQMVEVAILQDNVLEADTYLREYETIAPNDFSRYIFRYKIDKRKGEPYEVLIDTLIKLKHAEYIEQWAYELAKLYYKAGLEQDCIRECSDIILWFGEGSYVEKAKMLKAYYSGEIDKDEVIEELKKRASQEKTESDPSEYGDREELTEADENSVKEEPAAYEEPFTVTTSEDEDLEELTDSMKKEVEDILSKETLQRDDGITKEDTQKMPLSDRDIAEIEVEEELYRLLEEEDDDEESEKLKVLSRDLELDLHEIFGNFLHIKSVKKQLAKSLEIILDKHTKSVQMIITGFPGSGKTALAKDIAVFLYKTGKLKSSTLAKITAEKLNGIDVTEKKEVLRGCCLIIEHASELKRPAIDKLLELMKSLRGDIAVIFEENKKNLNRLFRECPKLMDLFKNRIHLPNYTEEELLGFAYANIRLGDYKLSPEAGTVLTNGLKQIIRKTKQGKQLEMLDQYVKAAMDSADVRTGKQLPSLAAQGRLEDVGILSILPEDLKPQH